MDPARLAAGRLPAEPGPDRRRTVRRRRRLVPGAPSAGSVARRKSGRLTRVAGRLRALATAPLSPGSSSPPLVGVEGPGRATPRPLGSPRGSLRARGEDAPLRLLQRASHGRAPVDRSIPEPIGVETANGPDETRMRPPRHDGRTTESPPTLRGEAPDRLATIRPRVSTRLTARTPLRPPRSQRHPRMPPALRALGGGPSHAALSTACEVGRLSLWRPLSRSREPRSRQPRGRRFAWIPEPSGRPASRPARPRALWGCARIAAADPSSTRPAFTTQDPFHRRVPPAARFHGQPTTRHRSRGFAAAEPASDALFTAPSLSRGGLDPTFASQALHLRTRRAPRRSSTSAIEIDPRAPPRIRRTPWTARGSPLGAAALRSGGPRAGDRREPVEPSRARGRTRRSPRDAFRRDRSRGSFAPTRSARTPPVAYPLRGGIGASRHRWRGPKKNAPRFGPTGIARAMPALGLPSVPLREEEPSRPHPRCLPPPDVPPSGLALFPSQSVPSLWSDGPTPFSISAATAARPARGARGLGPTPGPTGTVGRGAEARSVSSDFCVRKVNPRLDVPQNFQTRSSLFRVRFAIKKRPSMTIPVFPGFSTACPRDTPSESADRRPERVCESRVMAPYLAS